MHLKLSKRGEAEEVAAPDPVTDISGQVIQIGSEVTAFKVGDKVVCRLGFAVCGLAEYAVASETETSLRPEELSSVNAAGLPVASLTALECLQMIGTKFNGTGNGANILITAASGGVGSYAVQLAKLGGHHVTATYGARNVDLVRSLGADEVSLDLAQGQSQKNSSGKKYDYIINCAPAVLWKTLKSSISNEGLVMLVC
ncbi:quinone-oxidoreductase QR1, chloroplastic-like [Carex rostrata]